MTDETEKDKVDETAEEKPKPKRRRTRAKAKPAAKDTETTEAAAEEKPKPKSRARAKAKPAAEKKPADKAEAEKPKPAPKRAAKETDGTPPVVRAHAKYVRSSSRKARLVCDHIHGKSVEEARAILAFTPRAVARDWSKLLESAVANAEHNHELIGDDLRIASVTANEGPTLKRYRPRAMGRATQIRKRTAHLSIALTPKE